jgi:dolichol-phosphate mannosyltransferase
MGSRTALVVTPTLNERENLPILAHGLLQHDNVRLLVVDDDSPDGTADVAEALGREYPGRIEVMRRRANPGLGRSYVDGLKRALQEPVDVICQMDADLSHDPADLPRLIAATADADLVVGSRYVPGGRIENWPLRRRFLSRFANLYIRRITRLTVHDCTGGYRCWRRDALASLPLDRAFPEGYAFIVETLYLAAWRGCRIVEVPITFVERRHGESKLSWPVLVESIWTPWRLAATTRMR